MRMILFLILISIRAMATTYDPVTLKMGPIPGVVPSSCQCDAEGNKIACPYSQVICVTHDEYLRMVRLKTVGTKE